LLPFLKKIRCILTVSATEDFGSFSHGVILEDKTVAENSKMHKICICCMVVVNIKGKSVPIYIKDNCTLFSMM
jgi:hypothetical protein